MTTLAAQISSTGISGPSYADIFAQLQNAYWSIYGTDADLDADSQDGQFLAILAQAIYDCNQTAIAVYNAFSPATAQGAGLSSVVKINGVRRLVPTNSTVAVVITGTYGTPINGGVIEDDLNLDTQWSIPDGTTIGIGGTVDVTATCLTPGAVTAGIGTLTEIVTPIFGWTGVTNSAAATPGSPVEADATLRQRQSVSTSIPAQTPLENIYANVANVPGVERLRMYENDTDATDGNGIPSHSISAVVQGGTTADICQAIFAVKNPGTGTYGTTSDTIIDENGVPDTIRYFVLAEERMLVDITLQPLTGWSTSTEILIQVAIAAFLNSLGIGVDSYLNKLWASANLSGDIALNGINAYLALQTPPQSPMTQAQLDVLSATYNVTVIEQAISPGVPSAADVVITFNQAASGAPGDVTITVL